MLMPVKMAMIGLFPVVRSNNKIKTSKRDGRYNQCHD